MERINVGTYRVKPGETVGVEVRAVKVANFESYAVDDEVKAPVSDDPRAYEFEEPQNGGTITSDGVYTAPPQAGTYYVAAVSVANPDAVINVAVTVA
jgi:hypothetical protein